MPLLAEFSQQHPELRVRHVSSSQHADLISERFDVAIRLGTLADSRYHAALISNFTILPVAAPDGWLTIPLNLSNTGAGRVDRSRAFTFAAALRLGTLADSRYHAALISNFTILPVAAPDGWLTIPLNLSNTGAGRVDRSRAFTFAAALAGERCRWQSGCL